MPGMSKSNSVRSWSSHLRLGLACALLAAAGCGQPEAAGNRGIAGNDALAGSGGAAGNGGAAGDLGRPSDGGACVDPATVTPLSSSVSGSFSGPDLNGILCGGGVSAVLEQMPASATAPSQLALYIDDTVGGSDAVRFQFQDPADALGGELHIFVGLAAASSGTTDSSNSCGSVVLSAFLPVPASVTCSTDAGTGADADAGDSSGGDDCPAGCELTGPLSGQICTPIEPEADYVALASSDCVGDQVAPQGSWTLTLTSVTPYPQDAGADGSSFYQAHGTLTANLVGPSVEAGASPVALTLTF